VVEGDLQQYDLHEDVGEGLYQQRGIVSRSGPVENPKES
jgi:hypothetical protein